MKRPGLATIVVGLIAAVAFGAFIHQQQVRYFDHPKLCVEVMANLMAKERNEPADMFLREQADLLDLPGVTGEKLNEAWWNWIMKLLAKDHTPTEAAQWVENFRKRGNCT
jgi:hypothetical protein